MQRPQKKNNNNIKTIKKKMLKFILAATHNEGEKGRKHCFG